MKRLPLRFNIDDAERAAESWGANCGPGAIAAIYGLTLEELRPHLDDFESKGYTNPTLMWRVLDTLRGVTGLRWTPQGLKFATWPTYGLARVQWHGPWMNPGVPTQARYRRSHWVGAATVIDAAGFPNIGVFDINAIAVGGWIGLEDWGTRLVPWLLKEVVPRADGHWSLTHVVEVSQ